jgi:hypothetical protein
MGKSFLANIPPCTCEKSGLELCLAQDAGPLGNLGGQASWPVSKLPVWQWGKRYLRKGILKENLEAAGALGQRGSKANTTTHFYHNIFKELFT